MCDDLTKEIRIDDRLDSYESFFDHSWAKEMFSISENSPKVERLVLELTSQFKGISRTFALPSLAVSMTEHYWNSYSQVKRLPDSMVMKLISHLAEHLYQKVAMTSGMKADLKVAMLSLADEYLARAEAQPPLTFQRQSLWNGIVGLDEDQGTDDEDPANEYRLALWSCPRVCYAALFFAYEDFILQCVTIKSGGRVKFVDQRFGKEVKTVLGDKIGNRCWSDAKIQNAKNIRHALVHAGGRETSKLKAIRHGVTIQDGVLQIMPHNVSGLFNILKEASQQLVYWAINEEEFQ